MPSSGTTLQHSLLTWYDCERRALPWRSDRDSYRVWVAETMLQQTRVASVIPIFAAFVDRFPTIAALAAASEDQVLSAWSGLGYYSRARNLWRAAQHLDRAGRATFPQTYAEAVALPGVGAYT
ncbi:MAG TPA: A/G-specific adenine glycosylase, partial [Terriglobales bacterium]|nr:A/G-specific adenine glycosylase [Terriglobales bacterium]